MNETKKPTVSVEPLLEHCEVSDGYHTFTELYEHRFELYLALASQIAIETDWPVFRSKKHSDGTSYEGWFLLGVGMEQGAQISYHLPLRLWDAASFATETEVPPPFDGHTAADVLTRLRHLHARQR